MEHPNSDAMEQLGERRRPCFLLLGMRYGFVQHNPQTHRCRSPRSLRRFVCWSGRERLLLVVFHRRHERLQLRLPLELRGPRELRLPRLRVFCPLHQGLNKIRLFVPLVFLPSFLFSSLLLSLLTFFLSPRRIQSKIRLFNRVNLLSLCFLTFRNFFPAMFDDLIIYQKTYDFLLSIHTAINFFL